MDLNDRACSLGTAMLLGFSQIGKLADELVKAYSLRAITMLNVVGRAYEVMDDLKHSWESAYADLENMLASNSSLRRKDFELLMQHLVDLQGQRHQRLKSRLRHFSIVQSEITMKLRDALRAANTRRLTELKDDVQRELDEFEHHLKTFQHEQTALVETLRSLTAKGSALTIKELKELINH